MNAIAEEARGALAEKFAAREQGLRLSRSAIQFSATSIRATHRGEFAEAQKLVDSARQEVHQAQQHLAAHPDIYYAGFLEDAEKEYAEAHITLALVSGRMLRGPKQLGVGYAPYLNGLGEAVGELRRYVLDALRSGDTSRCEALLEIMDEVYTILVTMDFPDALTRGLRRTTDMVRGVLERTRGDLTVALQQQRLEERLKVFGMKDEARGKKASRRNGT
ncbi:MAG: haloacid dehalogenase [Dehalococcoidia bacterium]|nr:haloacid dehalogenase [Dehalococcoidia bacterium]